MKKFTLTIAIIALGLIVSNAQTGNENSKKTTSGKSPVSINSDDAKPTSTQADFLFEMENHDFGAITEGTQATYEFKFINTGKEPLVISNVQASCGCTTPKWSTEPIAPGKSGTITATYNSTGRPGPFTKTITITSNAKSSPKILTINGTVSPKAAETPNH